MGIEYLHTMVRVKDLDASIAFYNLLGLEERRRMENEGGRFTLVFLCPPGQENADVELTYNWDGDEDYQSGRNFGHQPATAGRAHGLCALAGQRVGGAVAAGRCPATGRALGQHGEHGSLVNGAGSVPGPRALDGGGGG